MVNPHITALLGGPEHTRELLAAIGRALPAAKGCTMSWTGEHMAYRCGTCGTSESSCMCVDCFDVQQHEGHDYRLYSSDAGGCCDCGDPAAWRPEGFCSRHTAVSREELCAAADRSLTAAQHAEVTHCIAMLISDVTRVFQAWRPDTESDTPPPPSRRTRVPMPSGTAFEEIRQPTQALLELANASDWLRIQICEAMQALVLPLPQEHPEATDHLWYWLHVGVRAVGPAQDDLCLLYFKLLYDPKFKAFYARKFMRMYPYFLSIMCAEGTDTSAASDHSNIVQFFERIFCQLFHSEKHVLDNAIRTHLVPPVFAQLGDMLLAQMLKPFERGPRSKARLRLNPELSLFHMTGVDRAILDLHALLKHGHTVREALLRSHADAPIGATWSALLCVLWAIQCVDMYTCHVDSNGPGTQGAAAAFRLHYHCSVLIRGITLAFTELLDDRESPEWAADVAAIKAFVAAIMTTVTAWVQECEAWDVPSAFSLLAGAPVEWNIEQDGVSWHPMLHELLASTVRALLESGACSSVQEALSSFPSTAATFDVGPELESHPRLSQVRRSIRRLVTDAAFTDMTPRQWMCIGVEHSLGLVQLLHETEVDIWRQNGYMFGNLCKYVRRTWYIIGVPEHYTWLQSAAAMLGIPAFYQLLWSRCNLRPVFQLLATPPEAPESGIVAQRLRLCGRVFDLIAQLAGVILGYHNAAAARLQHELSCWLALGRQSGAAELSAAVQGSVHVARVMIASVLEPQLKAVSVYHQPRHGAARGGYFSLQPSKWPLVDPLFPVFGTSERQDLDQAYANMPAGERDVALKAWEDAAATLAHGPIPAFPRACNVPPPYLGAPPEHQAPAWRSLGVELLNTPPLSAAVLSVLHNSVLSAGYRTACLQACLGLLAKALLTCAPNAGADAHASGHDVAAVWDVADALPFPAGSLYTHVRTLVRVADISPQVIEAVRSHTPAADIGSGAGPKRPRVATSFVPGAVEGAVSILQLVMHIAEHTEVFADHAAYAGFVVKLMCRDAQVAACHRELERAWSDSAAESKTDKKGGTSKKTSKTRAAALAKIQGQQAAFMSDMADLLDEGVGAGDGGDEEETKLQTEQHPYLQEYTSTTLAVQLRVPPFQWEVCVICHEKLCMSPETADKVGLLCWAQPSGSRAHCTTESWATWFGSNGTSSLAHRTPLSGHPAATEECPDEMMSCGHTAHHECCKSYTASLGRRLVQGQHFEGERLVSLPDNEFMCPICRRMVNTVLSGRMWFLAPSTLEILRDAPTVTAEAACTSWLTELGDASSQTGSEAAATAPATPPRTGGAAAAAAAAAASPNAVPPSADNDRAATEVEETVSLDSLEEMIVPEDESMRDFLAVLRALTGSQQSARSLEPRVGYVPPKAATALGACITQLELAWRHASMDAAANAAQPLQIASKQAMAVCRMLFIAACDEAATSRAPVASWGGVATLDEPSQPVLEFLILATAHRPFVVQGLTGAVSSQHVMVSLALKARWVMRLLWPVVVARVTAALAIATNAGDRPDTTPGNSLTTLFDQLRDSDTVMAHMDDSHALKQLVQAWITKFGAEWLDRGVQILVSRTLHQFVLFWTACVDGEIVLPACGSTPSDLDQRYLRDFDHWRAALGLPSLQDAARAALASEDVSASVLGLPCAVSVKPLFRGLCQAHSLALTRDLPCILAFTKLPELLAPLFLQYVHRKQPCGHCHESPHIPGICLYCGTMVCVNQPCCRVHGKGEATFHALRCGNGRGAFLLVQRTTVLLLFDRQRMCEWGSPYLDAFGEEDRGVKRGRPMTLSEDRVRLLARMLVDGSVLHDPHVLESSARTAEVVLL